MSLWRTLNVVDHLGCKEKIRERASMAHNYKLCNQLTDEINECMKWS